MLLVQFNSWFQTQLQKESCRHRRVQDFVRGGQGPLDPRGAKRAWIRAWLFGGAIFCGEVGGGQGPRWPPPPPGSAPGRLAYTYTKITCKSIETCRQCVARVSSARGPMLGCLERRPPRLVNPAPAPGGKKSTSKKKKEKKGLQHEKVETQGDRGPWKLGAHSICYFCY